jgi:hypothetical protein
MTAPYDRFGKAKVEALMYPATGGAAVVPHDTNFLAQASRGLWVGGAGNLVLTLLDGSEITLSNVPAGSLLPLRVCRVKTTSTATLIVALY